MNHTIQMGGNKMIVPYGLITIHQSSSNTHFKDKGVISEYLHSKFIQSMKPRTKTKKNTTRKNRR